MEMTGTESALTWKWADAVGLRPVLHAVYHVPPAALPCGLTFLTARLLVLSGYEDCCSVFEMNRYCPGYIFTHCGKSLTVK